MKKMSYCILILLSMTMLMSCSNKYYMSNMIGEEDIDITYWVVKKKYKPLYCNDKIYKLVNPSPTILNKKEIDTIAGLVKQWAYDNNLNLDVRTNADILKSVTYNHSYMLYYSPVDVYMIKLSIKDTIHNLYIRYDYKIMRPIKKDGWILSSCE